MGLFKKNKGEKFASEAQMLPKLPSLPKLPDFPKLTDEEVQTTPTRLPSYPQSSFGTKFSQNSIKEAVTGDKEDNEFFANDFSDEDEEIRMMQEPLRRPRTEEIGEMSGVRRNAGPVFIRIDKFEEAMKIFNETKKRISEIEHVLENIRSIKEKEDSELGTWEEEIKLMKSQIEKIDEDIFSKI